MFKRFKRGDKILCVDDRDQDDRSVHFNIRSGTVYTVADADHQPFVKLTADDYWWFSASRFVPAIKMSAEIEEQVAIYEALYGG